MELENVVVGNIPEYSVKAGISPDLVTAKEMTYGCHYHCPKNQWAMPVCGDIVILNDTPLCRKDNK